MSADDVANIYAANKRALGLGWCADDDRELIEALHVSTPLSRERAIELVNAWGGYLISSLLADGVPWYLLDASARACAQPAPWIELYGLNDGGLAADTGPWRRLGAQIVQGLRIEEIARWLTDRCSRRSGGSVGATTSLHDDPSDPTRPHR